METMIRKIVHDEHQSRIKKLQDKVMSLEIKNEQLYQDSLKLKDENIRLEIENKELVTQLRRAKMYRFRQDDDGLF